MSATKKKSVSRVFDRAAILEKILAGLADGVTLRSMCRETGMPNYSTVYDWINEDQEIAQRFAHARDSGYECIAEDIMRIVDEPPERTASGGVDAGDVGHKRLRAEMRLKLLAKWSPKKYGDKVTNEHTGENGDPIKTSLTVNFVSPNREK